MPTNFVPTNFTAVPFVPPGSGGTRRRQASGASRRLRIACRSGRTPATARSWHEIAEPAAGLPPSLPHNFIAFCLLPLRAKIAFGLALGSFDLLAWAASGRLRDTLLAFGTCRGACDALRALGTLDELLAWCAVAFLSSQLSLASSLDNWTGRERGTLLAAFPWAGSGLSILVSLNILYGSLDFLA